MEPGPQFDTVVVSADVAAALQEASGWLRRGQVVAFPTDTVYGLGAAMQDAGAVERLFQVKRRPRHMGIPLLLAEAADLERVCEELPEAAWRLVTGGRSTVAVRLPAHRIPRELASRLGGVLATTSANRSGDPSPVTAAQVLQQLGGQIPLILDGGKSRAEQASTIVDLTVEPPALLRAGPVSPGEIEAVIGRTLATGEPSVER